MTLARLMTPALTKRVLAETLGVLALCGSAYYFSVVPVQSRLGVVQAQVGALAGASGAAVRSPIDLRAVQSDLRMVTERADAIDARSRAATDETTVFTLVATLAKDYRVEVDHLQPEKVRVVPPPVAIAAAPSPTGSGVSGAPQTAPLPATPPPIEPQIDCTMTIAGAYADLSGFIDGLTREGGLCSVQSLQITPDLSKTDLARANLKVRFFGFSTASVRAMLPPQLSTPVTVQSSVGSDTP